jgi:hypothetical protein
MREKCCEAIEVMLKEEIDEALGAKRYNVRTLFETVERAALRPLPAERFPLFDEVRRKVARDGHFEVARAYCSVPPEYLGPFPE